MVRDDTNLNDLEPKKTDWQSDQNLFSDITNANLEELKFFEKTDATRRRKWARNIKRANLRKNWRQILCFSDPQRHEDNVGETGSLTKTGGNERTASQRDFVEGKETSTKTSSINENFERGGPTARFFFGAKKTKTAFGGNRMKKQAKAVSRPRPEDRPCSACNRAPFAWHRWTEDRTARRTFSTLLLRREPKVAADIQRKRRDGN